MKSVFTKEQKIKMTENARNMFAFEMGLKRGDNVIFDLVPSDDGYFKMCRR
jgi:hypothetical protein